MDGEPNPGNSYIELQRANYCGPPERKYDVLLDLPEVVVGRSPTLSTMIIPDPLISRQHVRLCRQEAGGWTVTDLSLNGVLLNGQRLVRQRPTPLNVSDTLQLDQPGKYRYKAVPAADRPPPAKRPLASAEHLRRVQEQKREQEAKQKEAEAKQREAEARLQEEKLQQEAKLKEAAAKLQAEKEREEAKRKQAEEHEAKIKEEKEKLEARLQQMQQELREQQMQAEEKEREAAQLAAKEREEYAKKMASLKEEMDKKEASLKVEMEKREQEVENEKRLRQQVQAQEATLKDQLSAEVNRLEQERRDIEEQLKGELEANNKEREQSAEAMQARCATIETQLSSLDAKRQLLEARLADTEREKEAACGRQLTARQAVLDSFSGLMDAELTCSICSELFFTAITLTCTHTFCSACISEWQKQRATCPICREPITSQTRSLVVDNFIDGIVTKLGGELAEHRATVRREREAAAAAAAAASARGAAAAAARGGRGGRHQQQRQQQQRRQHQQQQQRQQQQLLQQRQQQLLQQLQQGLHRPRGGPPPAAGRGNTRGNRPGAAAAAVPAPPGRARPVSVGRRAGGVNRDQLTAAINAALAAGANPQHPIVIDDTAYVLQMQ